MKTVMTAALMLFVSNAAAHSGNLTVFPRGFGEEAGVFTVPVHCRDELRGAFELIGVSDVIVRTEGATAYEEANPVVEVFETEPIDAPREGTTMLPPSERPQVDPSWTKVSSSGSAQIYRKPDGTIVALSN